MLLPASSSLRTADPATSRESMCSAARAFSIEAWAGKAYDSTDRRYGGHRGVQRRVLGMRALGEQRLQVGRPAAQRLAFVLVFRPPDGDERVVLGHAQQGIRPRGHDRRRCGSSPPGRGPPRSSERRRRRSTSAPSRPRWRPAAASRSMHLGQLDLRGLGVRARAAAGRAARDRRGSASRPRPRARPATGPGREQAADSGSARPQASSARRPGSLLVAVGDISITRSGAAGERSRTRTRRCPSRSG